MKNHLFSGDSGFNTQNNKESPFPQIEIKSATEVVYRELLKAILNGKFERGSLLRQGELAESFGVSRTPLREALMRLASMGLVHIESNRGFRVASLDFGNMQHAWRSRIFIESGAARLAAKNADDRSLEKMRLSVQRQYEVTHDLQESLIVNRDFHLALVAASGNPYLVKFAEMLWSFDLAAPIFGPQASGPKELTSWADEHLEILNAVISGNEQLSEELTRKHISNYPPQASVQKSIK
ncbi:GntR family transcriptional regulator [Ferviditalea candida]|uniref:GntR family transcriptional regulator n=1 Tax=Ferviditalea candida TaxID=3108399 RepID=A0ABU5ZMD5_9BACL|nr:GntR family transcriptional regulator [Paenibacillaceae bacterium T2]